MLFLLLSVFFSVAVSVLLKLVKRCRVDIRQAIAINYVLAALLVATFLRPNVGALQHANVSVWGVLFALGIILPTIFWVLAQAVQKAGMVRTDAAMRLSLLLPLVAAFSWFGEALTALKGAGLALGFIAIILIVTRPAAYQGGSSHWYWLFGVFVGFGSIDILFKLMARFDELAFASSLFGAFIVAALVSLLVVAGLYTSGRAHWQWRHLFGGLLLGTLNFGNILCYLYAHQALSQQPALVFAGMNIGVMVLAALVGYVLFRESLTRANWVGIVIAVSAVVLLASGY